MSYCVTAKKDDLHVGLCGERIYINARCFKDGFDDVDIEVSIKDIFELVVESMKKTYELADYQSQIKPIDTDGMFKKRGGR